MQRNNAREYYNQLKEIRQREYLKRQREIRQRNTFLLFVFFIFFLFLLMLAFGVCDPVPQKEKQWQQEQYET